MYTESNIPSMQSHRRQGPSSSTYPKESFLEHLLCVTTTTIGLKVEKKKTGRSIPAAPMGVQGVVVGLSTIWR